MTTSKKDATIAGKMLRKTESAYSNAKAPPIPIQTRHCF
jgi:hypothetical protein